MIYKEIIIKRNRIDWKKDGTIIVERMMNGATAREIALDYNVSKQAVYLGINKHYPTLSRQDYGASIRAKLKRQQKNTRLLERYNRATYKFQDDLERAYADKFRRKKQNVKYTKWEWDIELQDINFPTHCPILGIELNWFAEGRQDASPSFDRIDSTKGYIKGNVIIISDRANRLKNNGTVEEHRLIADFMEKRNL